MPELAKFYGIIRMYFQQSEHNPPHFHALYNGNVAELNIKTGEIIEGYLPKKALSMVREWAELHRNELLTV